MLCRKPLPPTPSPARRGGASQPASLLLPLSLQGRGLGGGVFSPRPVLDWVRRGEGEQANQHHFFSPSPLRGGGWGEGFSRRGLCLTGSGLPCIVRPPRRPLSRCVREHADGFRIVRPGSRSAGRHPRCPVGGVSLPAVQRPPLVDRRRGARHHTRQRRAVVRRRPVPGLRLVLHQPTSRPVQYRSIPLRKISFPCPPDQSTALLVVATVAPGRAAEA